MVVGGGGGIFLTKTSRNMKKKWILPECCQFLHNLVVVGGGGGRFLTKTSRNMKKKGSLSEMGRL